jgi:hypothetical protein
VLSRGGGWLWCAVHGPDLTSGQGPRPGAQYTAGARHCRAEYSAP